MMTSELNFNYTALKSYLNFIKYLQGTYKDPDVATLSDNFNIPNFV
jgi:hypothetical protein